jgi:hypothetical protein
MKNKHYKRKPGDFEIRILNNGKVIMITPNEALMEIARIVEPNNRALPPQMEIKDNAGKTTNKSR